MKLIFPTFLTQKSYEFSKSSTDKKTIIWCENGNLTNNRTEGSQIASLSTISDTLNHLDLNDISKLENENKRHLWENTQRINTKIVKHNNRIVKVMQTFDQFFLGSIIFKLFISIFSYINPDAYKIIPSVSLANLNNNESEEVNKINNSNPIDLNASFKKNDESLNISIDEDLCSNSDKFRNFKEHCLDVIKDIILPEESDSITLHYTTLVDMAKSNINTKDNSAWTKFGFKIGKNNKLTQVFMNKNQKFTDANFIFKIYNPNINDKIPKLQVVAYKQNLSKKDPKLDEVLESCKSYIKDKLSACYDAISKVN